jgi:hypothetical protein
MYSTKSEIRNKIATNRGMGKTFIFISSDAFIKIKQRDDNWIDSLLFLNIFYYAMIVGSQEERKKKIHLLDEWIAERNARTRKETEK